MKKIKRLSISDWQTIKSTFNLDQHARIPFENYFLVDERFPTFGYYINDILSEMICTAENQEIPAWSIARQYSYFNMQSDSFIKFVIDFFEKEKSLYQFFTLLNSKEHEFLDSSLIKYKSYLEHKLPAGQLTGYENIDHDILNYKTYNENLSVYLWELKNEYRIE